MLNPMSILNFTIAICVLLYASYLVVHGRPINRWMMVVNALAGLWSVVVFGLFILDVAILDILDPETIRTYCIRPVIFVLLCTVLANTIRQGWKN